MVEPSRGPEFPKFLLQGLLASLAQGVQLDHPVVERRVPVLRRCVVTVYASNRAGMSCIQHRVQPGRKLGDLQKVREKVVPLG